MVVVVVIVVVGFVKKNIKLTKCLVQKNLGQKFVIQKIFGTNPILCPKEFNIWFIIGFNIGFNKGFNISTLFC